MKSADHWETPPGPGLRPGPGLDAPDELARNYGVFWVMAPPKAVG